jgi:hypothetical protein
MVVLAGLVGPVLAVPAQTAQNATQKPSQAARTLTPEPRAPADPTDSDPDADAPPPGDWAPQLLDAILTSQNPAAAEALYDAAFAAGPGLLPQLQAALKDDRTAEFAAQALAFMGGEKAEDILWTLVGDGRNLDLRRFYLGTLGEYASAETEQVLMKAVTRSDSEPDRTVTEAAIWALTTRSEAGLPAEIKQAEAGIQDVAIRDEVDNARQVIESRLKYQASAEGRSAGSSLGQAVRCYFIGALQEPARTKTAGEAQPPAAEVHVVRTVFSPDQTRVLAHVTFEDPEASAHYDLVLQKQVGDWKVVSVWEGADVENPEPPAHTAPVVPKHHSTITKPPAAASPAKGSQATH